MTHTNTRAAAPHGENTDRAQDALAMLAGDHHKLQEIFKQYAKQQDEESGKEKILHTQQVCDELRMHVQVTGEIFYPALRRVMAANGQLTAAAAAHSEMLELIEQIEVMDVEDDLYDAMFSMLGDHLDRLIKIESGLFSRIRTTKLDTAALGERLLKRKIEWLMDEMGLPDGSEESDESITVPNYGKPERSDERDARGGRAYASLNRF